MTVEIERCSRDQVQDWNTIVDESPGGTLFHFWDWLEIAEKHTNTRLIPLMVKRDGAPLGIIPLFFQKKGIFRMVFSPPPRSGLFYLGPVLVGSMKDRQDKRETDYLDFHRAVEGFITDELKPDYTRISLSPGLTDPRPYGWTGYTIEPLYDYVTDLSPGEESIFSSLPKKQRQGINRSAKKGVVAEIGGEAEIRTIFDLMENRYEEQKIKNTLPREYLIDLFGKFRNNMTVMTARYNGEIITGLIDLHYRKEILSWIGNPKPPVTEGISPNVFISWEAIRYGCSRGFTSYVTMSAAGNQRLHEFYSSKFDSRLATRFAAKKSSFTASLLEQGYLSVVKPIHGKVAALTKKEHL